MITSSECAGFAYDPAKVEDQVQFLARTLTTTTLKPDGKATGCNPVEVGSTPTGVFLGGTEIGDNAGERLPSLWHADDLCHPVTPRDTCSRDTHPIEWVPKAKILTGFADAT